MASLILPPSVHYTQLLPDCTTVEKSEIYLNLLIDYSHVLRHLHWKFKYKIGGFINQDYYKKIQIELMEIERYIAEVEAKKKAFK